MSITDSVASVYLYGCFEDEPRRGLTKSDLTVVASEMTDNDLLSAVKKLTVGLISYRT